METKRNLSSQFGCLHKALPGEPMFILLGRDPAAPTAIRRWLKYRRQLDGQDPDQLAGAEQDAKDFAAWRVEHDGEWRNLRPIKPTDLILTPTDEIASIAGRLLSPQSGLNQIKGIKADEIAAEANPDALFVSQDFTEEVLGLAKRLAGFVLNADPQAGPND